MSDYARLLGQEFDFGPTAEELASELKRPPTVTNVTAGSRPSADLWQAFIEQKIHTSERKTMRSIIEAVGTYLKKHDTRLAELERELAALKTELAHIKGDKRLKVVEPIDAKAAAAMIA